MVERLQQRKREPEPKQTIYDQTRQFENERVAQKMQGKVIIKGKEVDWEQGKQGLVKFLLWEKMWPEVGTPGWRVFINWIKTQSGRHTHQGGQVLFVLEGKGYSIVDGKKCDWEEDDLIALPIQPGGVEHQHFNETPDKPTRWIAFSYFTMREQVGVEFLQNADHPDWAGSKQR